MSVLSRFVVLAACGIVLATALAPRVADAETSSPPLNGLFDRVVTDDVPTPDRQPIAAGSDLLIPTEDGFSIQATGFTAGLTPRFSYSGIGEVALGYDGYWAVFGARAVPTVVGARPTSLAVAGCEDDTILAAHAANGVGYLGCGAELVAVDLASAYGPAGPSALARVDVGGPITSIDHAPDSRGGVATIIVTTARTTALVDPASWSISQTLRPTIEVAGGSPTTASPERLWLAHDGGWQRYERASDSWRARGDLLAVDLLVDLGGLVVSMDEGGSMVFWSSRDLGVPVSVEPRSPRKPMLAGRWRSGLQRFWSFGTDAAGDHTATVWDDRGCTIVGTLAADVLIGTNGDDVLCGLGGDDILMALGGDDRSYGGTGDDIQYGGSGADDLRGEAGRDLLDGGSGDDVLWPTAGSDIVFAGGGDDWVYLRSIDPQTVFTGPGNDVVQLEERGAHWIYSGEGDDWVTTVDQVGARQPGSLVYLGEGSDRLDCGSCTAHGGPGNDTLEAGGTRGVEFLGGPGNDTLYGSIGPDRLWGGPGCDDLRFGPEDQYWANNAGEDGCVVAR